MRVGEQHAPVAVTAVPVLESLQRGEIDIQIRTAKEYPRSIRAFQQTAMSMATLDEATAESCFYAVPRDGRTISGPSVRLAEICVTAWGNLRAGTRIIDIDNEFVTAQAICHDLERNVAITVETKRRITNKHGQRYKPDMIAMTANAAAAIALRNAVFKIIPGAYIKPIYEAARKTAIGDASTLANRRAEAFAHFAKMGATEDRVLHELKKSSVEDVGLEDLAILKGLATAIRDADTTVDQVFPPIKKEGDKPTSLGDLTPDDPKPKPDAEKPAVDLSALRDEIVKRFNKLAEDKQTLILNAVGLTNIAEVQGIDSETDLLDIQLGCVEAKLANKKKPTTKPEPAHV